VLSFPTTSSNFFCLLLVSLSTVQDRDNETSSLGLELESNKIKKNKGDKRRAWSERRDDDERGAATDLNPLLDLRACVRACALVSLVSLALFFSNKAHLGKRLLPRTQFAA
jgi:hypothetical protein